MVGVAGDVPHRLGPDRRRRGLLRPCPPSGHQRSRGRSLPRATRPGPPPDRFPRPGRRRRRSCNASPAAGRRSARRRFAACRNGPPARNCGNGSARSWQTTAADSRPPRSPCPRSIGSIGRRSCWSRRWPAGCCRSVRRRVSPIAGGIAACRRRSSRCSGAVPRHRACPGRGCSCRCR